MNHSLSGKSILVTGGTGSFGRAFVRHIIEQNPDINRLVVYSRDELKQWEMEQEISVANHSCLRYFLGDIRDKERLRRALRGIDLVVHAAALKQVPAAEYNPHEFIKTNIIGSQNVIEASLDNNVKQIVALSTDKAASPVNLYGATKLCSDKLFIAANRYAGSNLQCSVVRYGNVMGSRGSVIPFFLQTSRNGYVQITDPTMTRFNITLSQGVEFVLKAVTTNPAGCILVPKLSSYRIKDVAIAIAPNCEHKVIGVRSGEKLHEEMITLADSANTYESEDYYLITAPDMNHSHSLNPDFRKVNHLFSYNSFENPSYLTVDEIRNLITNNLDNSFAPR